MEDTKLSVLMVEDDFFITDVLVRKFSEKFTTYSTMKAEEAFTIIKEKQPDVVLLDIELPEMNGLDILQIIRKDSSLTKQPVIVVLTNNSREDTEAKALELGADAFLQKAALNPNSVMKIVEDLITAKHTN